MLLLEEHISERYLPAVAACSWLLVTIVLEPQDVPVFHIQTCCIWVTWSNCLRDGGRELLSKICQSNEHRELTLYITCFCQGAGFVL